jgi:hypothetical protein
MSVVETFLELLAEAVVGTMAAVETAVVQELELEAREAQIIF